MSKIVAAVAVFIAVSVTGLGIIIANSDFYMTDPRFKGAKVKVTRYGAVLQPERTAVHSESELLPRVEIEATTFDFGILDPHEIARHDFIIKNVGEGPLYLENKGTSCKKCTVAAMSSEVVLYGEEAAVTIEWNTGAGPHYSQNATIGTNDYLKRSVQLRVEGKVRMHLGASPEELILEGIKPGRSATSETVLYSQVMRDVEVGEIKSSRTGFTWELLPADESVIADLNATWAKKLLITTPADLPSGPVEETVSVKLITADTARPSVDFDVRIRGRVKRNLAIYGPGIDDRGIVEVGIVNRSEGKTLTFKAKVHDPVNRDLNLREIECVPAFIKCSMIRTPGIDPVKGLYDLTLEIPADSPVCNYMAADKMGQIRIHSAHPQIGEVPLAVQFAVCEEE